MWPFLKEQKKKWVTTTKTFSQCIPRRMFFIYNWCINKLKITSTRWTKNAKMSPETWNWIFECFFIIIIIGLALRNDKKINLGSFVHRLFLIITDWIGTEEEHRSKLFVYFLQNVYTFLRVYTCQCNHVRVLRRAPRDSPWCLHGTSQVLCFAYRLNWRGGD